MPCIKIVVNTSANTAKARRLNLEKLAISSVIAVKTAKELN